MKYAGLVIDDWNWKHEKQWSLIAELKLSALRIIYHCGRDVNFWRQDSDINYRLLNR